MKHSREFEIAFVGLKPGEHEYHYQIKDNFFDKLLQSGEIDKPEFTNSDVEVKLLLDKKPGTMFLRFFIHGKVTIPCDRCGEDFDLKLWDEFELLVKIVDDEVVDKLNQDDAEVAYIGRSESLLHLENWLYEFITLSVPMQHVHEEDEKGNSLCNPEVLKYLIQQTPTTENALLEELKKKKLT